MSHTKGPWVWTNRMGGEWMLMADHGCRPVVMDFVRRGMNRAQPRFGIRSDNMGGIMKPVEKLPDFPNHPDALLIQAAPDLYEAALDALKWLDGDRDNCKSETLNELCLELESALRKATVK